ncbi:hypothetical protein ACFLQV_01360 [Calditrichota bacterium]
MYKVIVVILALVLAAGSVYAGSGAPKEEPMAEKSMDKKMDKMGHKDKMSHKGQDHEGHMKHDQAKMMNNVFAMDADGNRTALCGCGMEVKVSDTSTKVMNGDMTFYTCSQGCADMMGKMSEAEKKDAMMKWHDNFKTHKLASNAMMKDGKNMATCGCGMVFEVNNEHVLIDNGMKIHCCSEKCHSMFSGMPGEKRMMKEMEMMKGM